MSQKNSPRFLVADDHSIVRNGLTMVIKQLFRESEIVQASNFKEIKDNIISQKFDLLILDISFPEGNTLKFLNIIKELDPEIKTLIFSSFDEEIYALRYMKAGANGFLSKLSSPEEVENAITTIIREGSFTSTKVKNKIIDSFLLKKPENPLEELSDREMEIATMLVNGYGNLEISNELNLKATTVSTYKYRVFDKLRIENLSDLIQTFNLYNEKYV